MDWILRNNQTSASNNIKIPGLSYVPYRESNSSAVFDQKRLSDLNFQYSIAFLPKVTAVLDLNRNPFTGGISEDSSVKEEIKLFVKGKMRKADIQSEILKHLHNTLDHLHEECEEEGFEKFSEIARTNAKQILNFIYTRFSSYDYDIYPTDNREIFITCNPQKKKRVSILCDSNGSVAYFLTWDGKNSRFRCDEISYRFYDLLIEVFKKFDLLSNDMVSVPSKDSEFSLRETKSLNLSEFSF